MTRYPTMPASAATPLSRRARPMQSPMHSSMGRLANTTFPAALMTLKAACSQGTFNRGYAAMVAELLNAPPIPSSKPAAGRIAIGSINALPIFCSCLNMYLLFLVNL